MGPVPPQTWQQAYWGCVYDWCVWWPQTPCGYVHLPAHVSRHHRNPNSPQSSCLQAPPLVAGHHFASHTTASIWGEGGVVGWYIGDWYTTISSRVGCIPCGVHPHLPRCLLQWHGEHRSDAMQRKRLWKVKGAMGNLLEQHGAISKQHAHVWTC